MFAFIFIVFAILWASIDIYAYFKGDLRKWYGPMDTNGNICGLTQGYSEY